MSGPLYEVRELAHHYGSLPALDIPRLDIAQGAVIGLAGPNGSGKSTLLRILAFLEAPSQGVVSFAGLPRTPTSPGARQGITLLLQEPYLLRRSVAANLAYGLKLRTARPVRQADLEQALTWVGLEPAQFARRAWHQLSGGEAKRVALAARLVLKPQVLLLDEPTAGVDAHSADLLSQAALRARQEWGATLVVASHDLAWLGRTVDQIWELAYGRLVGMGPPRPAAGALRPLVVCRRKPSMAFSSWRLPKVNFGKLPKSRQISIWRDLGRAVLARSRSLSTYHSDRLLEPGSLCRQEPLDLAPGQQALPVRVLCLAVGQEPGQARVELRAVSQTLLFSLPLAELQALALQPGQELWLLQTY